MLTGHYEAPLVLISFLVALLASYTTFHLAGRVSQAGAVAASWWITGGAFAMGTGIWSMHFVGMLAFRLPIPLGYDPGITFLSWLLPVIASALALRQLQEPQLGWRRLAFSAGLIGLGISAMHYVGMAAMLMAPPIVYDPWLVAASIAIAIGAAGAALWIGMRLRDGSRPGVWRPRLAAATVMGLAIVGMHYTGMAAAGFPLGSVCRAAYGNFTLTQLATLVIVGSVAVLAITLLTAVYDARLEARNQLLTRSEHMAHERQVLLERERLARAEAERLSALKDEFLATLSHELRTPLNAIIGWVQLLRLKGDEASVRRGLETIERNARLQSQLISDLLDMSRIISGKVRLQPELVDAVTVVEAALESIRPAAFAKQVELVAQLEPPAGKVWGDPDRLQQILWNLLTNAVKFTPQGGTVTMDLRQDGDALVFKVSDTGAGIGRDFLPYVFDRFRQADGSITRLHGGLGLGLAIVRQLTHLHGGTIEAASQGEGLGATFTLRLPVAGSPGATGFPLPVGVGAASAPGELQLPDLAGMKVLVIDDEADARQLLQELLAACGAQVRLAESAEQGLAMLEREPPDVLVSDIGMPATDGYQLLQRVRAHADPAVASVPAVALTAYARKDDRQRATDSGFNSYLSKPIDAPALMAELVKLARRKRG